MNASNLSFIPLRQASLCLDCEVITLGHTRCMACGSSALLNVDRALSRHWTSSQNSAQRVTVVQMPAGHTPGSKRSPNQARVAAARFVLNPSESLA
jgi:hypothetical protein